MYTERQELSDEQKERLVNQGERINNILFEADYDINECIHVISCVFAVILAYFPIDTRQRIVDDLMSVARRSGGSLGGIAALMEKEDDRI